VCFEGINFTLTPIISGYMEIEPGPLPKIHRRYNLRVLAKPNNWQSQPMALPLDRNREEENIKNNFLRRVT